MKKTLLAIFLCAPVLAPAQQMGQGGRNPQQSGSTSQRNVYPVELSVPFGVVPGSLITSGDYLIFVDEQQPGNSFTIPKRELANFRFEGELLNVDLRSPIQDRSGSRTNLAFRVPNQTSTGSLSSWLQSQTPASDSPNGRTSETLPAAGQVAYQAKHNHTIGECTGRLIISDDRIVYESVTNIDDSRQWSLRDIRELKRDGSYKVEVQPFAGNTYNFELMGQAMDNAVYRNLVDRIAAARVAR